MLGSKGKALVIVLFVVMAAFTGGVRGRLDAMTESFRNTFREMIYLPRGDALKILASGFDAPLADALYIKGLVYYADALGIPAEERGSALTYSYALFDVITDLSPRFINAYRNGGTLLASVSSLQTNLDSVRLMDKGIAYWDKLERDGEKVATDPRWLFHLMQGVTYNLTIQNRLIQAGRIEEATETRSKVAEEFRLAALSPQAPEYVLETAASYQRSRSGNGTVEENLAAMLTVWQALYDSAVAKGENEMAEDMAQRLEENGSFLAKIQSTRFAEASLTRMGHMFAAAHKRAPRDIGELTATGILAGAPPAFPLDTETVRDSFVALPDGSFKSRILAGMEEDRQLGVLSDAMLLYRRTHKRANPPALAALVDEKFLDILPTPPLAALGQRIEYDAATGRITMATPYGPGY